MYREMKWMDELLKRNPSSFSLSLFVCLSLPYSVLWKEEERKNWEKQKENRKKKADSLFSLSTCWFHHSLIFIFSYLTFLVTCLFLQVKIPGQTSVFKVHLSFPLITLSFFFPHNFFLSLSIFHSLPEFFYFLSRS